jgi:putative ABC transport system permease protein
VAASEPVGVVNDAAMRTLFNGKDPMGRRVAWARAEPRVWIRVVGVAGDVRGDGLDAGDTPALYTPMAQESRPWRTWANVVVRSSLPPASLDASIKGEVGRVDKDVPVTRVRAMREILEGSFAGRQFTLALLGAFAVVAVVLAGVGIYGVMAYAVSRRTREIGLRAALGASQSRLLAGVFSKALVLVGSGIIAGNGVLLLIVTLSDEVGLSEVWGALLTTSAVMLAVGLLACIEPARRALHIHPTDALKEA